MFIDLNYVCNKTVVFIFKAKICNYILYYSINLIKLKFSKIAPTYMY